MEVQKNIHSFSFRASPLSAPTCNLATCAASFDTPSISSPEGQLRYSDQLLVHYNPAVVPYFLVRYIRALFYTRDCATEFPSVSSRAASQGCWDVTLDRVSNAMLPLGSRGDYFRRESYGQHPPPQRASTTICACLLPKYRVANIPSDYRL
ncbi:hypothetical protein M752DRAFT_294766 [Aspergillus phoenicis ATCC 13157]|uniref:Uncharacterized protein n=1 Tax=Aspergillus phoenicis ATCC 13157 TaxID=1353007 RepID=A0A370PFZ4_ASPPH|nr:hypothetical protein M752DRAFT_294766 [Aspergillus phoenicis ATCC 13157]